MVNGPPTPPASTPAELQDEARSAQPSNAQSTQNILPSAVNHPDFVRLATAHASRGDFQALVRESTEIDDNLPNDGSQMHVVVKAPLVLAYLILDDLPPARHTLLRLPEHLATLPLVKGLFTVVVAAMNRDYTAVYSNVDALLQSFDQDTQEKQFSGLLASLLRTFLDSFRHRTFALLSKAYTSLDLGLAVTYLGLPAEQVLQAAERNGWSYDPASRILYAKSNPKDVRSTDSGSGVSNLATFDFVADSVARLEM